MDAAAVQLLQILEATLSPDSGLRQQAEAALEAGAKQQGFATALMNVLLNGELPTGVRQLAGMVLKKCIKEHWTFEAPSFREPPMSEAEKAHIREQLPSGLADKNSKLRTAVAMAIAKIAVWDCPQAWPALLPSLLGSIVKKKDIHLVSGSVRCLAMFLDEVLSEEQILEIAPTLLPELLQIVHGDEYGPSLQRKALSIVHMVVGVLHTAAASSPAQVKALVGTLLADWFCEFVRILGLGSGAAGPAAWGVQLECLRLLTQLVGSFSRLCAPHLPPAMTAAWALFAGSLPLYQRVVVEGEELDEELEGTEEAAGGSSEDGVGGGVGLEGLVAQLLEFVLTLAGNQRYQGMVRPGLQELLYLTIGYMQMTAGQVDRWGTNPNEYVADEDDDFSSVRASGEMLLDEVVEAFGDEALAQLAVAAQRRLAEAAAARAAGHEGWWRLREAALLALGTVSERLQGGTVPVDVPALLESALAEDLGSAGGPAPPFLAGRALWITARLAPAVPPGRRAAFLQAAVAGLAPGLPPAVQIGACRALAGLCRGAAQAELAQQSGALFAGLCSMLQRSSEEVMHLVLETLTAAVKADAAGAAAWEPQISPLALGAWVNNVVDPLLSEDARELLEALAGVPACLPSLQARMLPTLCDIIAKPSAHNPVLVDGSVELITLVLGPSSPEAAAQIHAAATPHVLCLLLHSDDAEVLRSATSYLRTLLQVGGGAVLEWSGGPPASALQGLLQGVQRLLDPALEDHACDQVGSLILELLRHAWQHMVPLLPGLLAALSRKLASADNSATVQSLLTVVAQLVRLDTGQLVAALAGVVLEDGRPALSAVMDKWVERQIEIRTAYDIKLTSTALAALLTCGHPALEALQAEQWTLVPVRVKLLMLLVDAYIEATTQGEAWEAESEGEWEEAASSDDGSAGGGSLVNGAAKRLFGLEDALALADDDVDDTLLSNVDAKEAARRKTDPISQIDLPSVLRDLFRSLATSEPALLQATGEQLSPTQLQAMQAVFQ